MLKIFLLPFLVIILLMTSPSFSISQEIGNAPIIYQPTPDSAILTRNAALTGEGEAFDFLIGDWEVVITWQPRGKNANIYRAKWHNHWIIDGRVVMQEWRGPVLTGAEFRFYDIKNKSWNGQNIYANGAWRPTKSKSQDGNMVVTIFGNNKTRGDFLNRETYFNIEQNSFEMKSDISLDDGKTWIKGDYSMIVNRTIE